MDALEARAFALHYPVENAHLLTYLQAVELQAGLRAGIHESAVQHAVDFGAVSARVADLLEWSATEIANGNHSYIDQALRVEQIEDQYLLFGKTTQTRDVCGVACPTELELARAGTENELAAQRALLLDRLREVENWDIWAKRREADAAVRASSQPAIRALTNVHSLVKILRVAECPMCRNI